MTNTSLIPLASPLFPWINPVGGLGDTLMLSGVLKLVVEADPTQQFNCVVRTKYPPLLTGHPAIVHIGHPPHNAKLLRTDYWSDPAYGQPGSRAFQILARMYGLQTPVEERLFVPWNLDEDDPVLYPRLPWRAQNVLLCPTSESPRKQYFFQNWERLVAQLRAKDIFVAQIGRPNDLYVRGAYNLLGLTNVREAIRLIRRFDVVLTVDNFVMHAAHLCGIPAVVLWGPTNHQIYGYANQIHLQSSPCMEWKNCIGPSNANLYTMPCPKGPDHCMNQITIDVIQEALGKVLKKIASQNNSSKII